jgi:AcrR family transcriptional regulator
VFKPLSHPDTRGHILRAALRSFADRGYAATSVQQIVDAARVSKPALYYYFADKADLFEALVDFAHDERYRLMQEAEAHGRSAAEKLTEVVSAIFEFSLQNQDLMRLAFSTAFSMAGNAPGNTKCREKGKRSYLFFRSIVEQGQASGELTKRFSAEDLAMGIFGQVNSYVMVRLLVPDCPLDRETAARIVRLFLKGAAAETESRSAPASGQDSRADSQKDRNRKNKPSGHL